MLQAIRKMMDFLKKEIQFIKRNLMLFCFFTLPNAILFPLAGIVRVTDFYSALMLLILIIEFICLGLLTTHLLIGMSEEESRFRSEITHSNDEEKQTVDKKTGEKGA